MPPVVLTASLILDSAADLLKLLQSKERLPERGLDLQEELLGFYQALESFEDIIGFSEELQAYFVNCCELCIQIQMREDSLYPKSYIL
jgi:hypothetical protein